MHTASSASLTYLASRSASEYTITALTPSSWQARWIRRAISPRLATRIFLNMLFTHNETRCVQRLKLTRPAPATAAQGPPRRTGGVPLPAVCSPAREEGSGEAAQGVVLSHSITNSGCPYSTAWPFSPRIRVTVPDLSASISLRIFMASIMQMVSPSLTWLPTSAKALAPGLEAR